MDQGTALLEYGLHFIQAGLLFLEEESRVNGIAPQHGLFTGRFPVAGIVAFIFQYLHARLEKGVVVVVIKGDAGAEKNRSRPIPCAGWPASSIR